MEALELRKLLGQYKGAKVFLTGDTGFKGSWLALWLSQLGASVTGYALPPESVRSHYELLNLRRHIHHIDGDIRDLSTLSQAARRAKPEFLFHLAAQPLVRRSYSEPKLTFDTNVGGTVNVLDAICGISSLRAAVIVTSDKCYFNKEWVWGYRENDELGGVDPYSASKAAAEHAFAAYYASFFKSRPHLGAATARAGNVIGGGDWSEDRIVPDAVKALMSDQPIHLRNPRATRPWQHVLEPLSGYLVLAQRLASKPGISGSSWNFGPSILSRCTVQELAEHIVRKWGRGTIRMAPQRGAVQEAGLLQLNCDRAFQHLGWRPRWPLERTIEETVTWYKGFAQKVSVSSMSERQIRAYMDTE